MGPVGSVIAIKQMFTWHAMLDVLLIAAGLFFLYRTLMTLGTWRIVAGILVAMVVFLVANLLDLRGIEWVYRNVSHVAVIALIVIFQPELRKILERAASVRRSAVQDRAEGISQTIAAALWKLAGQHRGAIVVFPGKEPIREWISGGHYLDAEISEPLIMSIFDPHSPGHDGAVVVRDGRLFMFAVRLPVSTSGKLPEEFGTRHHAAMGLSEKTDALAVVVSEERGNISLFLQGEKHTCTDESGLAKAIRSQWTGSASYPLALYSRKRKKPMAVPLAVSLLVAGLFWSTLIVADSEIIEKVMTVPVEYAATPEGVVLVGEKADEVRLHLTGPKSSLDSATRGQLTVRIDLSKAVQGQQTFVITDQNIRLPKSVTLLDAVPSAIHLTIASIVEQELPVRPQLIGSLPKELSIESVEVRPSAVRVLSPAERKIEASEGLTTTPIYLENIRENTRIYCKIVAPPFIQPADRRWPDVEVVISVKR